jgi:hypothetical protein
VTTTQSPYVIEIGGNPSLTSLSLINLGVLTESNPSNPIYVSITIDQNPQLTGIFSDNVPTRCVKLNITKNNFTQFTGTFPTGTNLKEVFLQENGFTSISNSIINSTGIEKLYVNQNKLTSLPNLPNSIKELRCYRNASGDDLSPIGGLTSLPNSLPQSLQILEIGEIILNTPYYANNFGNFFTTEAGRPSNYFSNTQMVTFNAPGCGISAINLQFPTTIRTIKMDNATVASSLEIAQILRSNHFQTFDFSKCPTVTSVNFNGVALLSSLTNLNSCTNLQTFSIMSNSYQNTDSIFGVGNGFSIIPSLKIFRVSNNLNGSGFIGWDTFNFGGLTGNSVTIELKECGLRSSTIDYIINNLYLNYFNTTTNTRIRNSWTIDFTNTQPSLSNLNSNCGRTSASNVAYDALTNNATTGRWTISICGQPGLVACRTTGC